MRQQMYRNTPPTEAEILRPTQPAEMQVAEIDASKRASKAALIIAVIGSVILAALALKLGLTGTAFF